MPRKSRRARQVAALPYVTAGGKTLVLLVTTRDRRRWMVPKGWPVPGLAEADAAALEALEEAGAAGDVEPRPFGDFAYRKHPSSGRGPAARLRVRVYPLRVTHQMLDWKERGQRRLKWRRPNRAAEAVRNPGLAKLLRRFGRAGRKRARGAAG